MKLVLVNGKDAPKDKSIYIRAVLDDDGDVEVQVADNAQLTAYVKVGFFSVEDGKVKFIRYAGLTSDLVALDDDVIEVG